MQRPDTDRVCPTCGAPLYHRRRPIPGRRGMHSWHSVWLHPSGGQDCPEAEGEVSA